MIWVIHAITAVLSTLLTVVLMALAAAVSAVLLFVAFGLFTAVVGLLFGGADVWAEAVGNAAWWFRRSPRFVGRGCVRLAQRVVVWLPGPRRWHLWVARHPRAAQSARRRLVRRKGVAPEVLHEVFVNGTTVESVRIAVVRRCADFGGVARVMPVVAGEWGPAAYAWPLTYAGDAVLVQHALRRCLRGRDRSSLRGGYARLAKLAGPEVVWAMELEHVGSLEHMDPVVRESMQSGDTDVLLKWLD